MGVGDRYHFAWKGRDFTNGTFQGAVHGLACLVANNLLPKEISRKSMLSKINCIIDATRTITHRNGSLDEILPYEKSYCVTALVAYDTLSALEVIKDDLSESEYSRHLDTVRPLIQYITNNTESHGVISNHLAASLAALAHWQVATNENISSASAKVLEIIFQNASHEGWLREYNGADFGYQSLALDYLVDCHRLMPSSGIKIYLERAVKFLSYGAHPDGSFGGTYGSRNTRFLYPAGIEVMASEFPDAVALARFCRLAHTKNTVVSLAALDEPNFITMFNSFCRAAAIANELPDIGQLPNQNTAHQFCMKEAGLIINARKGTYSIINWRKGGSFYSSVAGVSGGMLAKSKAGKIFTSQSVLLGQLICINKNKVIIESPLTSYDMNYPTPFKMVILRILCLTLMRFRFSNSLVKKLLVKLLINPPFKSVALARRTISLPEFLVTDEWLENPLELEFMSLQDFQAIHMASQGYWQLGDNR